VDTTQWAKVGDAYTADIGGRSYRLIRNRKTSSVRVHERHPSIGRKPRSTTTATWYNVAVKIGNGDWRRLEGFASNLARAKSAALKHYGMPIDSELASFACEF
jgi:hypothetical protein